MSATWAIVLDHDRLRVYAAGTERAVAELPWQSDAVDDVVRVLSALPARPSQVVLVVGLAWLEATPVTLPPVPVATQRRMLQLDADRWFPLVPDPQSDAATSTGVAVAVAHDVALAMSGSRLTEWVRAFGRVAPVDAVITVPQAAWAAGLIGSFSLAAMPHETGMLEISGERVRTVRRTRQALPTSLSSLDDLSYVQAMLRATPLPLDVQLLDSALEARLLARRRGSWWKASVGCCAALLFCLWGVDQWREHALRDARAERSSRETAARPALDADARRQQALTERALIVADTVGKSSDVLAALGERLPADVFVQRAEWDGTEWRIDGSAADAARLVPLLSSLPGVRDVRALAPSTRFLDNGRPRSSFSIGFRTAPTGEAAP